MRAWLCYDMRTLDGGRSRARLTAAALEQVAWADGKGFEAVLLPEHHGSPDGYVSSPFVLGGAMAARTTTIRLVTGAVVLPLLNPLRLAEDAVELDLLSNGRLTVAPGLGYSPTEFEMFGVSLSDRVRLVEDGIGVLRAAFTGEPFTYQGRQARIGPKPVQDGGQPIHLCGAVPASARRAARLCDGYLPSNADLREPYLAECAALGKTPGDVAPYVPPMFVYVTEDPDKAWDAIAPHAIHEMAAYGRMIADANAVSSMDAPYREMTSIEEIKSTGLYAVVTPEQCVELVERCERDDVLVGFKPLMGGLDPDLAWESLQLFVDKVAPRFT